MTRQPDLFAPQELPRVTKAQADLFTPAREVRADSREGRDLLASVNALTEPARPMLEAFAHRMGEVGPDQAAREFEGATAEDWPTFADDDREEEHLIAEQEFEAEWPEDEREDDPDDDEPPVIQPSRSELPRDALGEAIIAAGLAPNDYLLNLNCSLSPPHDAPEYGWPWNLPSRLFHFPVETSEPKIGRDGALHPRRIGLMHPLLADHPFVREVERRLGISLDPDGAPNPYGYTKTRTALWWHAVDLVGAGKLDELLRTREFTTRGDICKALVYGMRYGPHDGPGKGKPHVSARQARETLAALDAPRPADTVAALDAMQFDEFTGEGGKLQRAINGPFHVSPEAEAWAWIEAIERGWIKQGRFATWTDAAKDRGEGQLL